MARHGRFVLALALAAWGCAGCMTGSPNGNGNDNNDNTTGDDQASVAVIVDEALVASTRVGHSTGLAEVAICDGWFPAEPSHLLTVESGLAMTVTASSDEPVRLWILCGESNFCGEEVAPNSSELGRFWNRATCEVYVGVPDEGGEADYTLVFTAD